MSRILIFRSNEICNLGAIHLLSFVDIPYFPIALPCPVAVGTYNHTDIFSATRAVVRAVSLTHRATHWSGVLRNDQHRADKNADATDATAEMRHPSMMEHTSAHMASNPKIPAKIVKSAHPASSIALRNTLKHFVCVITMKLNCKT